MLINSITTNNNKHNKHYKMLKTVLNYLPKRHYSATLFKTIGTQMNTQFDELTSVAVEKAVSVLKQTEKTVIDEDINDVTITVTVAGGGISVTLEKDVE